MTVLKDEELRKQTERLRGLMARARALAAEAGVPVGEEVSLVGFNHRAKELAITKRVRTGVAADGATTYRYKVSVSDYFVDCPDEELLSVLAHELVHTVRDGWGHGAGFDYWARKFLGVGVVVDAKLRGARAERVVGYAGERLAARPTVRLTCGCSEFTVGARTDAARHPEDFRCKKCGRTLRRTA